MLARSLAALLTLSLLPALTACDLDPADDGPFAFVWSSDDAPGVDGRIRLDPDDPLIVRIRVTNPFAEPAIAVLDAIVLRPTPGTDGAETVIPRPMPIPLDADESTEVRVGQIALLPADECEIYAEGRVTSETGEAQSFAITSDPIVLGP